MNALEIRDLTKQYGTFCLDRLNLTLPSGCIMGLIGENGAGKSTTIRLILNMIQRDGGTVRILGKDNREDLCLIKEDVGVVLDEVGMPECLTAHQISRVMAGSFRNWDDRLYADYLARLHLPANKPFRALSRGMKMKMGIAVAMSHHPKLLILDEATSGLDPVIRDEVVELFGQFTREECHSVLISSHIVSDLEKICDYIAFLHKGRLLLCEEKDIPLERFGVVHGSASGIAELDPASIVGRRDSAYGVEAMVRRDRIPRGMPVSPVGLEELFLWMVKGVN